MRPNSVARLTNAGSRAPFAIAFGRLHARVNRATGGRLGPRWFGAPVLVLETVGRRSGKQRATPLVYVRPADTLVVLAANAGSDSPPAWWLNLRDGNAGTVVLDGRRIAVRPRVLDGAERATAWDAFVGVYPAAEGYLRFTDRELPLIALEPA